MRNPFLIGERSYLRFLEESDVNEDYIGWLNNKEVTRYLETGKFPSTALSVKKFLERFSGSSTDLIFGIIAIDTDEHIGNVTLNQINWIHRTAVTGIMIGRESFRGRGYGFEAWSLILEYAFERLGLRRIEAGAVDANMASIATMKKLGFKEEGIRRKHVLVEGEYRDAIKFGLFKEEFYKYR
jgi:[ribosomal protein S5]-alanine N-acetyltransferase